RPRAVFVRGATNPHKEMTWCFVEGLVIRIMRGLGTPSPYKKIAFWFGEEWVFFANLATLHEKKPSFS
ncbi:MAG: hypothetical protein Q7U31_08130, partial [Anaerolineaceae bacterium]|nr:hypothetical protein [Anaerolineaceae bacterium]